MNLGELILDVVLIPASVYLTLTLLFRQGILLCIEKRYAGEEKMKAFLLPYHRANHLNFNKELDTAEGIKKFQAYAWGMSAMGMMVIFQSWQSIENGKPFWLIIGISILTPMLQGYLMARAALAVKCFRALGITSLAEYFRPLENDRQLAR